MLSNCDRAKIAKNPQQQTNESRINKVPSRCVAKLSPDQFSQRRREIAPSVRINKWIQRQGESLPRGPGEQQNDHAPVARLPGETADWIGRNQIMRAQAAHPIRSSKLLPGAIKIHEVRARVISGVRHCDRFGLWLSLKSVLTFPREARRKCFSVPPASIVTIFFRVPDSRAPNAAAIV